MRYSSELVGRIRICRRVEVARDEVRPMWQRRGQLASLTPFGHWPRHCPICGGDSDDRIHGKER